MCQPSAKNLSFNAPVVSAFHRAGWQTSVHISFQEHLQVDIRMSKEVVSVTVTIHQLIGDKQSLGVRLCEPLRWKSLIFLLLVVKFLHMYKSAAEYFELTLSNGSYYHDNLAMACWPWTSMSFQW